MKKVFATCISLALIGVLSLSTSLMIPPPEAAHAAVSPQFLQASETKDWGSLADGAGASEDLTVFGAVLGDVCFASHGVDVVDLLVTCDVTAAGVATVRVQNETTGAVDLASTTLRVIVLRRPQTGG